MLSIDVRPFLVAVSSGPQFVCVKVLIGAGYIDLTGGFHLELVHSGLGLGNVELVAVLAGHNDFLLFLQLFCFSDRKESCALGIARVVWLKENRICRFSVGKFFSVHSHRKRNLTIVFLSTIIYDKSCRIRRYLSYDLSR